MNIYGPGDELLTINAQVTSRIFDITATAGDVTISDVTLTGGRTTGDDEEGGAIRSYTTAHLTIHQSTVIGNRTLGDRSFGGGILVHGNVTLEHSTVSGNKYRG